MQALFGNFIILFSLNNGNDKLRQQSHGDQDRFP